LRDQLDQRGTLDVNGTIFGKVMESNTLKQQAGSNTKEQFANSPNLQNELQNAIIESYDAHTSMSTQALNSPIVLRGILDILLNHSQLYEALRKGS
jgi:type I restriction enzyme R subunit